MALIECPECGKKVSDTAPACIHCGHTFTVAPPEKPASREVFADLPADKQKQLIAEFYRLFPEPRKAAKMLIIMYSLFACGTILGSTFLCVGFFFREELSNTATVFIVMGFVLLLPSLGLAVFLKVSKNKLDHDALMRMKVFALWLDKCKKIEYKRIFDPKKKAAYDALKISDEYIRRIEEYGSR